MEANHHIWRVWAENLHRWGVSRLVASILEEAGPLTILGAQAIYLGQPALSGLLPASHLQALADLFEDRAQAKSFVAYLREGS